MVNPTFKAQVLCEPGVVLWFTGLPGAGKTTLSQLVGLEFQNRGKAIEILDGDAVRHNLSKDLGFTRNDREENIRRIGFVTELLTRNGINVIVAAVSPYRSMRDHIRSDHLGRFVEVFVDCPIDILIQRDRRGIYRRALAGEVARFTGVSDPYEPPTAPEIHVRTDTASPEESAASIVGWLESRGIL